MTILLGWLALTYMPYFSSFKTKGNYYFDTLDVITKQLGVCRWVIMRSNEPQLGKELDAGGTQ